MAFTKVVGAGIHTLSNITSHNINSSGIITATKFVGPIEGDITAVDATFTGNVSIAKTLTYEDVENVDSVGIVTARQGIQIPNDTYKLRAGTELEMQVFHNGTNSVIKDTRDNGKVRIQADNFDIRDKDDSQTMIAAGVDGSVSLSHSGNQKIQTTSHGISVTGIGTFSDAVRIVKTSGPLLELTTNTGAADATLRLSEGATGSTTNGGGMFYSGADNKLYITCGTDSTTKRITINRDDGNVGIGSDSPTAKLDVAGGDLAVNGGNLDVTGDIRHIGNTNTKIAFTDNQIDFQCAGASRLYINNYGLYVESGRALAFLSASGATPNIKSGGTNNQDLLFTTGTGNPTRLHIKSDGKVGIGTDNPGSPLEVSGGTALDTATFNTYHANGVLINLQRSETSKGFLGSGKNIADATGGVDDIGLRSNANLILTAGGGTERLRITSDGSVGIGITNPGYRLEIGNILSNNNIKIGSRMTGSNYGIAYGYYDHLSGQHGFGIDIKHGGTLVTNAFVMRADSGNVGISRTTPSYRLHIHTAATNSTQVTGLCIANDASSTGVGAKINLGAGNGFDSTSAGISGWYDGTGTSLSLFTTASYASTGHEERLRIDANGKVSIASGAYGGGGTTPELYVKGTSGRQMKIHNSNAGTSSLQITNASTGEGEDAGTQLFTQGTTGDFWIQSAFATADLVFATKPSGGSTTEKLRIKSDGNIYHTGGRIFSTRATGEAGILIGSGNAGGATLYLDGDANGDWSGGDYAYIRHNTSGNLDIVSTNPNDDGQITFNTGAGTYYGGIGSTGVLTMNGAANSRAIQINAGGNASTLVFDRGGQITSNIRASDGGSNVAGGSGGGSRLTLAKNEIYMYTYNYTSNIGDAPSYSQKFRIDTNGNFHGSSTNSISDQRLKKDIVTITDPLTKIKGLTGRTFKWKEDSTKFDDKTKYGFIAQEVETTIPELVDTEHGIILFDEDDKVIYDEDAAVSRSKAVNETGVIPITVEALKVLISKVETLEAKVAALEGS